MEGEDDWVVIECKDPNLLDHEELPDDSNQIILISTAEISSWDLQSILTHHVVRVKINRTRQVVFYSFTPILGYLNTNDWFQFSLFFFVGFNFRLIEQSSYFRSLLSGNFR